MRALILASGGQLGHDLCRIWPDSFVALTHADLDVCDGPSVRRAVMDAAPELVINAAAYHRVDEIESNPGRAFEVNALGAKNVADAAREAGAAVMFISTDYVFDGEKGGPYVEDDLPRPLNVYGVSKLAGEHLVRQSNPKHYVVRSSSLFGVAGASGKGGNFVETMVKRARAGEPLRVVNDQVSSPTFTADLAQKLRELAATGRFGLYHVTNTGRTSWHDFAQAIFEAAGLKAGLTPITSEELGAAARRPRFSVLEHKALRSAGLAPLRPWQDALAAYLAEKGYLQAAPAGSPDAAR